MELNIYNKREVVKTYKADTYDLMFGTLEEIAKVVNIDALQTGSDVEIIKLAGNAVFNSMDTIKDLMKDIFEGITDEELKCTKVSELAGVLVDVTKYTIKKLTELNRKNA